ncbi:DUF6876 family protein [Methylocystis sp. ATCC 49242]|uniref:DUF6876 family protein n=1 Tax=Methylocystis sp. ATCC 49242 TaxID=622637 RepID=UPI0001F87106|nr:DUF6876 family protein [Methylocystis sp. ATCC 49242]
MTLKPSDLAQFTGSFYAYRHNLFPNYIYTDGVQYVAINGRAYWLIDEIVLSNAFSHKDPKFHKLLNEAFQTWTLKTDLTKNTAILTTDDGNGNVLYTKDIRYMDFPLEEIKFFLVDNTLMLPSEY